MIRVCPDHGYYDALEKDSCPRCGEEGDEFLSQERRVRLSKLMSGALRHFPGDLGLNADREGWVEYERFVEAVTGRRGWATGEHVAAVVETDPKGRFELRDGLVRASYGHSIDVEVEGGSGEVPDELYHGTASGNLDSILREGIQPMERQEVHLSANREVARDVGLRHSDEIGILVVDAAAMQEDGCRIEGRAPKVYTTARVPPRYVLDVEVE